MISNLKERKNMPSDLNYQVTRREWSVLNDNDFLCSCCGFQSAPTKEVPSGYVEVFVNSEGEPFLLCSICATSKKLGRQVSGSNNHGLILHVTNLEQAHVSNVARITCTSLVSSLPYAKAAQNLISQFQHMQATKKDYLFLTDTGSVIQTVTALTSIRANKLEEASSIFQHLKYFPSKAEYRHILKYWHQVNPDYFSPPPSLT